MNENLFFPTDLYKYYQLLIREFHRFHLITEILVNKKVTGEIVGQNKVKPLVIAFIYWSCLYRLLGI